MGEIVGAGLLAHVPTIVLPDDIRRELNNGQREHALQRAARPATRGLQPAAARPHRRLRQPLVHHRRVRDHRARAAQGLLHLRGAAPGHVERALRHPGQPGVRPPRRRDRRRDAGLLDHADRQRAPAHHVRHARTSSRFLQGEEAWVSVSVVPDRRAARLRHGRAASSPRRSTESDLRVVLIASGALSHTFHTLRTLRDHEAAGEEHIFSSGARDAGPRGHRRPRARRPRPAWSTS